MRKVSKNLIFALCISFVVSSSFSTYAGLFNKKKTTATEQSDEGKKERVRIEENEDKEMIIGKIKSISADNVIVEIATRKERTEAQKNENKENKEERQKPNIEDRFTLTGETKNFNIASADLGRKMPEKPEDFDKKEKRDNKDIDFEKGEKLTYSDYSVGDFVRITTKKDNETVAIRMRKADFGFDIDRVGNNRGGYKGKFTGKTKAEKQEKSE